MPWDKMCSTRVKHQIHHLTRHKSIIKVSKECKKIKNCQLIRALSLASVWGGRRGRPPASRCQAWKWWGGGGGGRHCSSCYHNFAPKQLFFLTHIATGWEFPSPSYLTLPVILTPLSYFWELKIKTNPKITKFRKSISLFWLSFEILIPLPFVNLKLEIKY